ncbi:MAG: DNA topoisomerase 4 subunit A [Chloroflexi bacterium]|nr:DNA topoisomerase 4 subunit A [Chloroflexota bacterium]
MAKSKSQITKPKPRDVIKTVELADDMTEAYIGYARETITDRALPDVRDGLKPVQRRIMYGMHGLGLVHNRPHKKSARIVGEVLGKYHPHGDSSVYLAMVRQAQPWVMEVPLVDGQGNFGSIDGDSPAAMRYTEARLTPAAETMLQDLKMDTVGWADNFDGSLQEPIVLPSVLPNLLINGVDGIAVGMATRMPPHNLDEVCNALIHMAQNWKKRAKITVDDLMAFIPGPDFPTGGIIYRHRDEGDGPVDIIRQAYETGRGRIVMQSRVTVEDIGGGKANVVVTELPYGVLKTTVIEKIAKEVRDGRITGVTDLRDESDHTGMRVVVEVSRQSTPGDVLKQVLKYSQLRETFGVINLALVPTFDNGGTRPKYLSLLELLTHFVKHRLEVIERRSRFELERRLARLHIVEGLLKALDILDQVIDTIRRSRTADTARTNLMKKFAFSELQATAILDMQLRRLAALERKKLDDERKELKTRIKYLEGLLRSEAKRLAVVIEETTGIKEKFAIPRRTVIMEQEGAVAGVVTTEADLVMPEATQLLALTPDGVQRTDAANFSYRASRSLTKRPVRDVHLAHMTAEPNDEVIMFTNRGRGWRGTVGFIPAEGGPKELGLERVVSLAVLRPDAYLVMGSRGGKVKRTHVNDLSIPDRDWGVVMGLADGDELLFGDVAGEGAHVLFYTLQGQLLRLDGDAVNPQQTHTASGVAGIKLRKGDRLLGGMVVSDAEKQDAWQVVVFSTKGYAHRTRLAEFSVQGRGATGVRCLRSTKSGGDVGGVAVGKGGTIDVYLEDGRRQRLNLKEIPAGARDVLGQRLIDARGGMIERLVALS